MNRKKKASFSNEALFSGLSTTSKQPKADKLSKYLNKNFSEFHKVKDSSNISGKNQKKTFEAYLRKKGGKSKSCAVI